MTKPSRKTLEKQCDLLWRKIIQARDKVCRVCNHDGRLEAHHVMGRIHRATRWDPGNGILLCWNHHVKYGHADPETLRDNIIDVIGAERYGQLKEKSRNYGRPFKMDLGDLAELKARLADQLRREEGA